jgi:aryl-alcohol dehydrogenase-like predicted oxidoreductase
MEMRKLAEGLDIAPLMFGGNVFGWTADEARSHALLDAFVDGGFNAIDTADVYSAFVPGNKGGESETVLGTWFAKGGGRRDKVILATKLGMKMGDGKEGLSKAYVHAAVDASLKRLQTDHIDLYQAHRDDTATPQDETLEAFGELIAAGKVRAIGASNFTAARLDSALAISAERGLPRYQTLQPLYNLYSRDAYEAELEPACAKAGIAVIPYFSLASGFLTGKYRSEADFGKSPRGARMGSQYMNERGFRILAALDTVAAETGATPAQISLAWLMSKPTIAAPIASATSLTQLEELMGAAQLTLSAEARAALDAASG